MVSVRELAGQSNLTSREPEILPVVIPFALQASNCTGRDVVASLPGVLSAVNGAGEGMWRLYRAWGGFDGGG